MNNNDEGDKSLEKLEKVVIVHPHFKSNKFQSLEQQMEEANGLALAIHLSVVECLPVNVTKINPGHFLGKGSRENVLAHIKQNEPNLIIFNYNLSPVQQRNLEREWQVKVIDRTGLILEIFGERAQTKEGKIQVELAALEYQRSRLVRSWTYLERQKGGAGFMGGPGETQIEMDRRIIGDRIVKLKKDLEDVKRTRNLARKSREKVPFPVIALVGYTNAGKSTLFNKLTGSDVMAEDLLFATLDPTMRKISFNSGQEAILADTVGFIADLPTHLIAAFRATLEQVQYADVILHVRDISRSDTNKQRQEVINILGELGIDYDQDYRIIEVLNKVDLIDNDTRNDVERICTFNQNVVALSAVSGENIDTLLERIEVNLSINRRRIRLKINSSDGRALAWLYENTRILNREDKSKLISLEVEIEPSDLGRFERKFEYKHTSLDHVDDRLECGD